MADIAASGAKIFTLLDALKGYHQCPLDQDSQSLTTFTTLFGQYKYLRVPYGISSISEHYNRRMTEAFRGLSEFRRIVDDFVIYDSNINDHVSQLSAEGYQVDPSITAAFTAYPSSTNHSELRSFICLVNQLSTSTNTLAKLLGPLRPLLSTKNEFLWSTPQEEALN